MKKGPTYRTTPKKLIIPIRSEKLIGMFETFTCAAGFQNSSKINGLIDKIKSLLAFSPLMICNDFFVERGLFLALIQVRFL